MTPRKATGVPLHLPSLLSPASGAFPYAAQWAGRRGSVRGERPDHAGRTSYDKCGDSDGLEVRYRCQVLRTGWTEAVAAWAGTDVHAGQLSGPAGNPNPGDALDQGRHLEFLRRTRLPVSPGQRGPPEGQSSSDRVSGRGHGVGGRGERTRSMPLPVSPSSSQPSPRTWIVSSMSPSRRLSRCKGR